MDEGLQRHSMFPLGLLGASTRVEYQPLGCVGNVVPWNFPFNLCFGPMGSIFAAGNRTISSRLNILCRVRF